MFSYILNTLSILLQWAFFLLALYYLAISVFALFPSKHKPSHPEKLRFAVVIPAHNEEKALPGLLQSLNKQSYPQNLFSVFVLADRCTDKTLEIIQQYQCTPLLRNNQNTSGKGSALQDAFSQILALSVPFDAFLVLDADNVADERFIEEINHVMQQGSQVVQGYIDSKNPEDNWLTYAYSTWYWLSNRTIQTGYTRLGLGCKLGGTGFALSRKILETIPWETVTMAEDAEYTLSLALSDITISYAPKAIVYDEKPTTLSVSIRQRIRWMQGMTQVQRDYGFKLIRKGKWNAFFRFWSDFLSPLTFFVFLVIAIFSTGNLLDITKVSFVSLWTKTFPYLLVHFYLFASIFCGLISLIKDKKWNFKIFLNLFGLLLFLITWVPAGIHGIIHHNKTEWYHTKHHSGI